MLAQIIKSRRRPGQRGFTMLELLIVVLIIGILMAVLLPVLAMMRQKAKFAAATNSMRAITIAMEDYRTQFLQYPPQDYPSSNGSEIIWYYLCRQLAVGEMKFGPYLEAQEDRLRGGTDASLKQFITPWGYNYTYYLLADAPDARGVTTYRRFVVIDPGPDGEIAGGVTAADSGDMIFKPATDPKAGHTTDDDNIYSNELQ